MSDAPKMRPSFSTGGRWRIGLDAVLRTVLVLAVVVMVNYLGARFYQRFHLSQRTHMALSSSTLNVLRGVTNRLDIILYYDRRGQFYQDVADLVAEYRGANKNISVQTVDYEREPDPAKMVNDKYQRYFGAQSDKDLVIFDYNGRVKVFPGEALTKYETKAVTPTDPKQKIAFNRRPIAFNGEEAFTSIILSLVYPQPLKAYFLQGHGEASLTDTGSSGYQAFAEVLAQNSISVTNLPGIGNNGVPLDCSLLVIAGPEQALSELELQEISQYLREGGSLLVMFDFRSHGQPTGLESVLQPWGIAVLGDMVREPHYTKTGYDVFVGTFNKHPVVDSLGRSQLQLYSPYPVGPLPQSNRAANAPEATALFGSSTESTLLQNSGEPARSYPLACAVEQKPVAGVSNPRGNTRIIAIGDDVFLGNYYIDGGDNRNFLSAAVNWLCDRETLVAGIGPRQFTSLHLRITRQEQRELNWLLLGALPGAVLGLGWLVWLVRRK
jgi:hypothetical protein